MHASARFTGLTLTSCCLILATIAGGCRVCSPQPNLKTGYQVGRHTCETVIPGEQYELPCSTPNQVETTALEHVERTPSRSDASDLFYGIAPDRPQAHRAESFVHEFPTSFAANRPSVKSPLNANVPRPYQRQMPASRLPPSSQPVADARDATGLPSTPHQATVERSTPYPDLSNIRRMIPSMPSWGQAPARAPRSPRGTSYSTNAFPYGLRQDLAQPQPSDMVGQPSPSTAGLPNSLPQAHEAAQESTARRVPRHPFAPGSSASYWDRVETKR